MSHAPQRTEKDCLNCGTIVQGHYCQNCGQENVVPRETFWHMVTHFFYDITHFDSKFFETLKFLIFKPGFLPAEYMKGRRARYLHPIKMYVFTSAVFFLLFFAFFKSQAKIVSTGSKTLDPQERLGVINSFRESLARDTGNAFLNSKLALALDTTRLLTKDDLMDSTLKTQFITFGGQQFTSKSQYDSFQQTLPNKDRDGWFGRRMIYKGIELNEKYGSDPDEALAKLGNSILHRLPYMLFVSLPLFALLLKLVYIRRKQFYYADHGVFTIHLYVFSFILLLVVFGLSELNEWLDSGFMRVVGALLFVALFFYLYKSMRNFYGQRRAKTFIKFVLVAFFSLLMMVVLFAIFTFFSAITL